MGCRGVFVKAQDVILQVRTEGGDSSVERAGGRAGTASSVPPSLLHTFLAVRKG